MELFIKEHGVMNALITNFDSAIANKANKTDFIKIDTKLRDYA
jgi:hypothetical protein